jgi:DNA-binding MarR family transcriptional regulator
MSTENGPGPMVSRRLGYLLKHAQQHMEELNRTALAPFGIDGRELGILLVIAGNEPDSQQQAAQRLGIDRTSMVARLDALEDKGLITRHPHAGDRRRNVVELTSAGRDVVRRGTAASERAEAELLRSLTPQEEEGLRDALRTIVVGEPGSVSRSRPAAAPGRSAAPPSHTAGPRGRDRSG